ncbi:protein of unknown function [Burkholderia multivorans]
MAQRLEHHRAGARQRPEPQPQVRVEAHAHAMPARLRDRRETGIARGRADRETDARQVQHLRGRERVERQVVRRIAARRGTRAQIIELMAVRPVRDEIDAGRRAAIDAHPGRLDALAAPQFDQQLAEMVVADRRHETGRRALPRGRDAEIRRVAAETLQILGAPRLRLIEFDHRLAERQNLGNPRRRHRLHLTPQIVAVRAGDLHRHEVAHFITLGRLRGRLDVDDAVDFRRVRRRAADAAFFADLVDQHLERLADLALDALRGHFLRDFHEARAARLAHVVRQRAVQFVRARAFDRRIREAADAIQLCLADEVEQRLELLLGLAGEARDEGAADRQVRADLAPFLHALEHLLGVRGPLHPLEHLRVRVLERHVEIRQHVTLERAFGHHRDDLIDVRVRIHVMQAHPRAVLRGQLAERADELRHAGLERAAIPEAGAVLDVDAVRARVLRDHEQFLDAGLEQVLRLQHHFGDRTGHEIAAHRRDDAERAAVIAAFGYLQVRVMARRELDAGGRHEIDERIVRLRQVRMDGLHHFADRVRAGDGEHLRMHFLDEAAAARALLRAEAAGDDHLAVFVQRLADRVEAFLHRFVDEAAGVDDDEIGAVIGAGDLVALRAQLGDDLLGVDERFRAPEGYETYTWILGHLEMFGVAAKARVYSHLRFSDPKHAAGGRRQRRSPA